ncbi:MAG TPA: DinB family protein [Terriglobales bacterium]|nr:DinB family protein [Terriglobales bacterium]
MDASKQWKFCSFAILMVLVLSTLAAAQDSPVSDPTVPANYDKEFALRYLAETREKFLASINGLSEAQWKFKPAADRWSVGEVSEHVTKAEEMFQGMVRKMMESPADPAQAKEATLKEANIVKMVPDRSTKFQAPDPLKPTGRWPTQTALVADFERMRKENADYLAANYDGMRQRVQAGPPGTMDGVQWMVFMAAHLKRHTAQIEEVKADPAFPKK